MKLEYAVDNLSKYINIRQVLKEEFLISDRLIIKLKKAKQIYLNGFPAFINQTLSINDKIVVDLDFEEDSDNIVPVAMNLNILYEDDAMLIINKLPFTPVHPSINHFKDSLSNGVKYYFDSIGLKRKIRPVMRLDKNTSGIVIFAKNEYVQECLIKQMKSGDFKKEYLAIVNKIIDGEFQVIDAPISRKNNSIIERCVSNDGDNAITEVQLIESSENYSLVKCNLKTGRTHQIRVHLSYIGHSILGDDLYGTKSALINRQALHAYKVMFIHPLTHKKLEINCKLPEDILKLIKNKTDRL